MWVQIALPVATLIVGLLIGEYLVNRREKSRWRADNVWRPLFNDVTRQVIYEHNELDDPIEDSGQSVDEFAMASAGDAKLLQAVADYRKALTSFNALSAELKRIRKHPPSDFVDTVVNAFPKDLFVDSDNPNQGFLLYRRANGHSFYEPDFFVDRYWFPLLKSKSGDEVRSAIISKSDQMGTGVWTRRWFELHHDLGERLFTVLAARPERLIFTQLITARAVVTDAAKKIKTILDKKL